MPQTLDEILSDNRDRFAFDALAAALASPEPARPIAMVGAGCSARLSYPSWKQLLDEIHDELEAARERSPRKRLRDYPDLLWRAQEYRSLLGDEGFRARIGSAFGSRGAADACLDDLVRLPFRHFVTTNYDPTLEEAHARVHEREAKHLVWGDPAQVLEFMCGVSTPGWERRYVHLHGRFDQPQSIVLSDADYTRRYVQSDETTKKLFALFAMHRFVFVGFSLSDPDLMEILREVNAHLGAREPRHFALIGVRDDEDRVIARDRLVLKFGVAPIFFDVTHDFEGLPTLVHALAAQCFGLPVAVPEAAEALQEGAVIDVSQHAPGFGYAERETDFSPAQRVERPFRGVEPPDLPSRAPAFAPPLPPQAPSPAPVEEPTPPVDPDDPHKGQFGWEAERDGRALRGRVERTDDPYWFRVELEVASTDPAAPLAGPVTFHLHPTFSPDEQAVAPADGVARLRLTSYGAFTVGAETAEGTRLELCLASIPDAPIEFRMR